MKAYIFSGGKAADYSALQFNEFENAFVICADSGFRHAQKLGVEPDFVVGDNDSYRSEYPAKSRIYPCDKDKTDTGIALDIALERGCDEIILLCGTGGRLDQEFTHFCLMAYALRRGARMVMLDEKNVIWMENKPFTLSRRTEYKYVSFFPWGGDVKGLRLRGLKYETDNLNLVCDDVQASSNEFTESERAEVSFKSGNLLVMLTRD